MKFQNAKLLFLCFEYCCNPLKDSDIMIINTYAQSFCKVQIDIKRFYNFIPIKYIASRS